MTVLDWLFMSSVTAAILASLFFVLFLFLSIRTKFKLKNLQKRKIKNKRKRKKLLHAIRRLKRNYKQVKLATLFSLFITIFLLSTGFYTKYYQATRLSEEDSDSITQGYYLLRDFEEELNKASQDSESQLKTENNLRYLSSAMSSYGNKKASLVNTEEGQIALNRFYTALKEIGTNAVNNYTQFYNNAPLVEEYKADIQKALNYEKKVFELYKVNEAALEKQK